MVEQGHELPQMVELLQQGISRSLHIGAQACVWHQGRLVADLAIGEARPGLPMQRDTLMLWLSACKPIAAVAIAQLWERGKLRLDDPVARHIPPFAQNGKDRITIRHLLTHTSGLRWIETGWPSASWDQIIGRICSMRTERDWTPGKKAGYSATVTWFVLGEIVRRVDGRDYARYVREEIFEPLQMNDCWFSLSPDQYRSYGQRIGIMHKTEDGRAAALELDSELAAANVRPAASGRGPIRELARFYQMLLAGGTLDGRRIISPQSVEALVSRHRAGLMDQTFRHVIDWGLGFVLSSSHYGDADFPYGYGPFASYRTYGHAGNQSSFAFADPENQLVAALVCNGMPGEAANQQRMTELQTTLYRELGLA